MKKTVAVCGTAALAAAIALTAWLARGRAEPSAAPLATPAKANAAKAEPAAQPKSAATKPAPEDDEPEAEELSAEEKSVNAFDDLTDKWSEPRKGGVTMEDAAKFAEQFRQVPTNRQDECIHRALNLVPDENVMLLAGILMDKSVNREIAEAIFHDVLNRDEEVKKPIMLQIHKDKTHPCWEDVEWVLEATGEKPETK